MKPRWLYMREAEGNGGGGDGSGAQSGSDGSQAQDQSQQDEGAGDNGNGAFQGEYEPERARKLIDSFREKESAWKKAETAHRQERQELERLRKQTQDAANKDLSEKEQLSKALQTTQSEKDQALSELRTLRLTSQAERAAQKANARSGYIDLVAAKIMENAEVSDAGEITNMKEIVDHVRKNYPLLFSTGSVDGGANGNGAGQNITSMDALIRNKLAGG